MQPPGPTYLSTPRCAEHGYPAVARCVACGRLVCADCRMLLGNRNFCMACVTDAFRGYPPPARPVRPLHPPKRAPAREAFPGVTWGVLEALTVFFATVLTGVTLVLSFKIAFPEVTSRVTSSVWLVFVSSVILYSLMLAGTYFSVTVRHQSGLETIGLKMEGAGRGLALGVGIGLPLFVLALGAAFVSQVLYNEFYRSVMDRPPPTPLLDRVSAPGMEPWPMLLFVVTLVLLAPVCEEIFFRGYLYPAIRNRMSMQGAMIVNGLIFAAAHFEVAGFLPRFVLGYGLCYLYERNRNITSPIVGHALYNGLLVALFIVFEVF